ncbi:MAG: hypothetical protein EA351_00665, partial [Gemmatimonadales bacterium]
MRQSSQEWKWFSSGAVVIALVSGCGTPSEDHGLEVDNLEAVVTRDSAGIQILESSRPAWPQDAGWQVEIEPFLQLGSRGGDEWQPAFGRIADAVRFEDGRIAVGDQQAMLVHVFDSTGRFLETWGGRGQGPGEFQRIDRLAVLRGDSLVVRNEGLGRHEVYGPDGVFARTVHSSSRSGSGGMGEVSGWLQGGSFIVASILAPDPDLRPGRQVVEGEWYRFGPTGEALGLHAVLPQQVVEVAGSPPRSRPVALAPQAQSYAAGPGLWHGFPNSFEVHRIGPDGPDRIFRRAWTPLPVTTALKEAYRSWYATPTLSAEVSESARAAYVQLRRSDA